VEDFVLDSSKLFSWYWRTVAVLCGHCWSRQSIFINSSLTLYPRTYLCIMIGYRLLYSNENAMSEGTGCKFRKIWLK
jgi:hypothetical protein